MVKQLGNEQSVIDAEPKKNSANVVERGSQWLVLQGATQHQL